MSPAPALAAVVMLAIGMSGSAVAGQAQVPDGVVKRFAKLDHRLTELTILDRARINDTYQAILVEARYSHAAMRKSDAGRTPFQAYGLFVVNRSLQTIHFTVDIYHSPCMGIFDLQLDDIDEDGAILAGRGCSYGMVNRKTIYSFDLRSGKVTSKKESTIHQVYLVYDSPNALFAVSSEHPTFAQPRDQERRGSVVSAVISPGMPIAPERIKVFDAIDRELIDNHVMVVRDSKGYLLRSCNSTARVITLPGETGAVKLLKANSCTTTETPCYHEGRETLPDQFLVGRGEITETVQGYIKHYQFTGPTLEQYAHYRPGRATSGGYFPGKFNFETSIGPYTWDKGIIWFGISFYDGEGTTGVNALGRFDTKTKQYHLEYFWEIADHASSAIMVDDDYVWLGLVTHPEGADCGEGLFRLNRKDGTTKLFRFADTVSSILRRGENVYAFTDDGFYVIHGDGTMWVGVRPDPKGRYHPDIRPLVPSNHKWAE